MFFKGIRTQVVLLLVLAAVGGVGLWLMQDLNASPYALDSEADRLWKHCRMVTMDSRQRALCLCPVDQLFQDAPEALCMYLQETQHAQGVTEADAKACMDKQDEESLRIYHETIKICAMRYQR